jgi:hypothetical protein
MDSTETNHLTDDSSAKGSLVKDGEQHDRHRRRGRARKERESKRPKKHKKHRKRRCSSSSSSTSDESDDSSERRRRKRRKKREETTKETKGKGVDDKRRDSTDRPLETLNPSSLANSEPIQDNQLSINPSTELQKTKARPMVPMTKEQYEAKRAEIREEYDPESGRYRLVRGTGEVLERIVSRDQHVAINRQATRGDGDRFARTMYRNT